MSIFEFAMQMEQDGEKYYRELANKTNSAGLKRIFNQLADDEVEHYKVFKNIKDHGSFDFPESTVLKDSKNIFENMKTSGGPDTTTEPEQKDAYGVALEMEKKSYTFYEEKAESCDNPEEKKLLQAIAREEHRHYRLIEGIIDFICQPETWLENAEFVHLTDY